MYDRVLNTAMDVMSNFGTIECSSEKCIQNFEMSITTPWRKALSKN